MENGREMREKKMNGYFCARRKSAGAPVAAHDNQQQQQQQHNQKEWRGEHVMVRWRLQKSEKGYVGGNFTQFQAENKACNCIHSV